uniref:Phosphate acetyltransferase n=1 Tax=Candidatus Kentrum sp. FW TaxID=2126338 RepID=A0A450THC1_9GAMM|nr:MAG: phosphate acetyltransferase [Candidatus Kentron sp. FW]
MTPPSIPRSTGQRRPIAEVADKAMVFIFPDLNAGNNTYKAIQRPISATAIGPILRGLKNR